MDSRQEGDNTYGTGPFLFTRAMQWLLTRDGLTEPSPRQGHYQHKVFPFAHRTWSQTTAYISTSDQLLQQWINGSQHNIIVAS